MKELIKAYQDFNSVRGSIKDIDCRINQLTRRIQSASSEAYKNELKCLVAEQEERKAKYIKQQRKMQRTIDSAKINERDKRLLTLRYIDCLSWQQVAFRMGVTDEALPRLWHKNLMESKETKTSKNSN